jgi:penicillin-binding protein 1C
MARVVDRAYVHDHRYDPGDIHGPRLWDATPKTQDDAALQVAPPVFHAGAAWLTLEAMTTLRRPDQEGKWESFATSRKIAWKTGTSFGYRDAWAVGITPGYTVGVWVGNADGEGRPGVIGLHAAAPLLFDVFRMLGDDSEWFSPPYDAMTRVLTCAESGWPAGESCTQVDTTLTAKSDNAPQGCRFHYICMTDAAGAYRYSPECQPARAVRKTYFVVPPIAENFYKRNHPAYRLVPPWHPDCGAPNAGGPALAILYPRPGSKIYVPTEWDRKRSRAVFTAVHRSDTAAVYWHLDRKYIGKTRELHQLELDPSPGRHVLVLQDEAGEVAEVVFDVLPSGLD